MVKNIADIAESSDSTIEKPENANFSLPIYTTIGFSRKYRDFILSLDNELIYGNYGGRQAKKATFWFVRAGLEKAISDHLALRCGLTLPVIARTDTLGNLRNDLPWPKMGGSVGVSARFYNFRLDLCVYGDPAKSYVDQKIRIRTVGSLTILL